jgi:hypothetical protein
VKRRKLGLFRGFNSKKGSACFDLADLKPIDKGNRLHCSSIGGNIVYYGLNSNRGYQLPA